MRITGGVARGHPLKVVGSRGLRPTSDRVRSALFQVLGPAVDGVRALDLYAGCGALGLDALSRGAAQVDFVEVGARLCQVIRDNLARSGFQDRGTVYQARVEEALSFLHGSYGMVFMDPPYEMPGLEAIVARVASSPLLPQDGVLVVEHAARKELSEGFGPLHRRQTRRYGDTALSLYTGSEADSWL